MHLIKLSQVTSSKEAELSPQRFTSVGPSDIVALCVSVVAGERDSIGRMKIAGLCTLSTAVQTWMMHQF